MSKYNFTNTQANVQLGCLRRGGDQRAMSKLVVKAGERKYG